MIDHKPVSEPGQTPMSMTGVMLLLIIAAGSFVNAQNRPEQPDPLSQPDQSVQLVHPQSVQPDLPDQQPDQQPDQRKPDQQPDQEIHPILEEYLRIASQENPELRALWHRYRSELEKVPQVGTLPDPEVTLGYDLNPMMPKSVLGRFSGSVMQMFPWFGTLESRRELQRATSEADLQQLNSRQLELLQEVQSVWYDLSELQQKIAIAEETIELVRDLEILVETRYETGRAGQADLLRIQMEEQRLRTMIANLEDKMNPVKSRFNALLNRDADTEVQTAPEIRPRSLPYTEEALKTRLLKHNPQFDQLDARRRMLNEQKNQARLDGRPHFGIGLEVMGRDFGVMSMHPDMNESFIGMATIRVPIYRSRYNAQYRQASEQLHGLDYEREEIENELLTRLEEALERFRESGRSVQLLDEELIPRAEQVYAILADEYAAGNVRFDEVLRILRELLDLDLERMEVLIRQNKSVITIESITEEAAVSF